MIVRLAEMGDLPAIVEIYNQAIAERFATADTAAFDVEQKKQWFREHDPRSYPVYVADQDNKVAGWCSLSPYRPGRAALRFTAEISYYVDKNHRRQGIASRLIRHAMDSCGELQIKSLFTLLMERNVASIKILEKFGFQRWGLMPRVADYNGDECGHLIYGLRLVP
jgi:phosphinothricin acetyltransferase